MQKRKVKHKLVQVRRCGSAAVRVYLASKSCRNCRGRPAIVKGRHSYRAAIARPLRLGIGLVIGLGKGIVPSYGIEV